MQKKEISPVNIRYAPEGFMEDLEAIKAQKHLGRNTEAAIHAVQQYKVHKERINELETESERQSAEIDRLERLVSKAAQFFADFDSLSEDLMSMG